MIKTIKRSDYPLNWDSFIDDFHTKSYEEHRRGSNFFTRFVYEINEKYFPHHPELWGFWESETVVWDSEYGSDDRVDVLHRVEKKEKQIIETVWEKV